MKLLIFLVTLILTSLKCFASINCSQIKFSNVGWTDITASTALATEVLTSLGYETKIIDLSVPLTFAGLKNKDIDIFLGNWMPTMNADINPYLDQGSIEIIGTVLKNAKYTLAVPNYVYNAGVKNFNDIAKFKNNFNGKIYGIESGNDGNRHILDMINNNSFNLKDWKLIESSEQAMLMEVKRSIKKNKWIIFLAWEPHPMNKAIHINYLKGGDKYFGPNEGSSTVYINSRKNFTKECPNISKFFKNFNLSIEDENAMMSMIIDQKISPEIAAKKWVKENLSKVNTWIIDVKKINGEQAKIQEIEKKLSY